MKIEYDTQFDIGDIVYVMDNGCPRAARVKRIRYEFNAEKFGHVNEKMGYDLESLTTKDSLAKVYGNYEIFATLRELRDYVFPPEKLDKQ